MSFNQFAVGLVFGVQALDALAAMATTGSVWWAIFAALGACGVIWTAIDIIKELEAKRA